MCWRRGRDSRSEDHELEGDERFGIGGHHTLGLCPLSSVPHRLTLPPCVTSWRHHLEPKKTSLTMRVCFLSLLSLLRYESAVDGLKNTQEWRKMERKWTFFNFKIHNVAKHNFSVLISDYISIFWLFCICNICTVWRHICAPGPPQSPQRGVKTVSHIVHIWPEFSPPNSLRNPFPLPVMQTHQGGGSSSRSNQSFGVPPAWEGSQNLFKTFFLFNTTIIISFPENMISSSLNVCVITKKLS